MNEYQEQKKGFFSDFTHIPPVIGGIILLAGIVLFYNDAGLLGNFVIISLLVGFLPFIFVAYFNNERIRAIEEQFPIFLRDIAESQKAGTSLPDAFRSATRTDYGKLSKEIKKISDQLSWGIPLQEVLNRFSGRMKNSEIITRSTRIMNEAYSSGGDIAETMESVATDVNTIKESQKERTSAMTQHISIMYIIYFVFIAIVISLSKTLFPMLEMNLGGGLMGGGDSGGFNDPCASCTAGNIMCISCSTFTTLSAMFSFGTGAMSYYRALFFSMIIVQGIFSGLIAGQIGSNSALAGVKHSVILTATGFGIFMIALRLGMA
ncbi:MAG: type II secretion system F family protein [Candidatus Aenigmatarchaeota archaeon]